MKIIKKIDDWFTKHWVLQMIILMAIIFGSIFGIIFYLQYLDGLDDEEIVVEGKIINVEYMGKGEMYWKGDTFNITFDDGTFYIVETGIERDFTVNSKFIIKMFRDSPNSHWVIEKMYKVPSEV